jgi:hypothetical protein
MLDRIQTRTRMTANEPPSYVDLDLTSEPAPNAKPNAPSGRQLAFEQGQSDQSYDPLAGIVDAPFTALGDFGGMLLGRTVEEQKMLDAKRAAEEIGATELQNPALRPAVQPTAPAGETPKPPSPPKDTTPQGGGISTETAGVSATPDPATSSAGRGSGAAVGGSNAPTSYEQELRDAMIRAEKRANQDKWMALAQVGMQLMASKEPTLGGALGEAGIAGLQNFQQSRDGYEAERLGLSKSLFDLQQNQAAALAAQRAAGAKATRGPNGIKDIMAIADQYDKAIKSMMVDDGLGGLAMPTDEQSVARIAELRLEKDKYIGMMIPESTFDATAQ